MIGTVKTDGFEMDYLVFGEGKRILVIIPGLSIKSVILSSAGVEAAYGIFKKDFTVYLFDRRRTVTDGYTVADTAEDIAAAMMKLGIEKADVFGVSQGGMAAQYIAIEHPELINKLVLGSTTSKASSLSNLNSWREYAQNGDINGLAESFMNLLYSEQTVEAYSGIILSQYKDLSGYELERFAVMAKASDGFDVYGRLEEIRCPTLVLGAVNDKVIPAVDMEKIAEKLNCAIYMYVQYGHAVYDEAPDYKSRIMDFLLKS